MSFLNSASNNSSNGYFDKNIQSILDKVTDTEDLILWIFVVVLIFFGVLLNCNVLRSMLNINCNGKCLKSICFELYCNMNLIFQTKPEFAVFSNQKKNCSYLQITF